MIFEPCFHRFLAVAEMDEAFRVLIVYFYQDTTSCDRRKMSKQIIKSAYEMVGGMTPLKSDCGRLCGAACCSSEGYMLLFPYEQELVGGDFKIVRKELEGYGPVDALYCDGECDRDVRPLSCRIFPLAPKFMEDKLFVRLDPRGRVVCSACP